MKLRRTMKAQRPKKKEKERNNNNNNNNKVKKRGSWSGQRKDPARAKGHAARTLIGPEDMQQGSWSGQRICSKKNQYQDPMYVQMYAKGH